MERGNKRRFGDDQCVFSQIEESDHIKGKTVTAILVPDVYPAACFGAVSWRLAAPGNRGPC